MGSADTNTFKMRTKKHIIFHGEERGRKADIV